MTRTRSNYAHSLLALASATAANTVAAAPDEQPRRALPGNQTKSRMQNIDEKRARKAIQKKLTQGKTRRMLNKAADPEAGARRDAERKERKRMAKQGVFIAPSASPARKSVRAVAMVSPGGKHWEVSVAP